MVRSYPDGRPKPHQGVDYYAKPGTTSVAIKDGNIFDVRSEKEGGDYGLQVIEEFKLEDGKSRYAVYAHGSESLVKKGDLVKEGDPVMKTGVSGNAKNLKGKDQHLHLEVRTKPNVGKGLAGREDPNNYVDTKFHSADPTNKKQSEVKVIKSK
jgi:murein DD-endopeptidase MepM/ murein hydrolase activator NlpD